MRKMLFLVAGLLLSITAAFSQTRIVTGQVRDSLI